MPPQNASDLSRKQNTRIAAIVGLVINGFITLNTTWGVVTTGTMLFSEYNSITGEVYISPNYLHLIEWVMIILLSALPFFIILILFKKRFYRTSIAISSVVVLLALADLLLPVILFSPYLRIGF